MNLKKNKTCNSYNLEGLTTGKLLAIRHAMELAQERKVLSPVGKDVLIFLQNQSLT
jgi:hypothetical protein